MASYLRPRRGTASAASAIVLKKGEIFCEFKNNPATTSGGTSCGAIKLGNGTTSYQSLGYFLNPDTDVVTWAATTAEGQPSDWGTYGGTSATSASQGASYYADLNALVTGSQNKKVLPLIKNLLFKLATGVTKLNSDISPYKEGGTHNFSSTGLEQLSALSQPIADGNNHLILVNMAWNSGKPSALQIEDNSGNIVASSSTVLSNIITCFAIIPTSLSFIRVKGSNTVASGQSNYMIWVYKLID